MNSDAAFCCVPFGVPPGNVVRTPENRLTGLYFFLSSLVGESEPSTAGWLSDAPSAKANVDPATAIHSPVEITRRDFLSTSPPAVARSLRCASVFLRALPRAPTRATGA